MQEVNLNQRRTITELGGGRAVEHKVDADMAFNPVIQDRVGELQRERGPQPSPEPLVKGVPQKAYTDWCKGIADTIFREPETMKKARAWERSQRRQPEAQPAPAAPDAQQEEEAAIAELHARYVAAIAARDSRNPAGVLSLPLEHQRDIAALATLPTPSPDAWFQQLTALGG